MTEISRKGHRQRVKQTYLDGSSNLLPDHNLLELLLFYSIPRKDVKPIAYNLINRFGSLEAVFDASIEDIAKVDGVGESTAILINLCKTINTRIILNKNDKNSTLNNYQDTIKYVDNILKNETVEKFLVISLSNKSKVINHHIISTGGVNHAFVDPADVAKCALNDNASAVIIAHNHPNGNCEPSNSDTNITVEILNLLRSFHIHLNDHIIVGQNKSKGLSTSITHADYFK